MMSPPSPHRSAAGAAQGRGDDGAADLSTTDASTSSSCDDEPYPFDALETDMAELAKEGIFQEPLRHPRGEGLDPSLPKTSSSQSLAALPETSHSPSAALAAAIALRQLLLGVRTFPSSRMERAYVAALKTPLPPVMAVLLSMAALTVYDGPMARISPKSASDFLFEVFLAIMLTYFAVVAVAYAVRNTKRWLSSPIDNERMWIVLSLVWILNSANGQAARVEFNCRTAPTIPNVNRSQFFESCAAYHLDATSAVSVAGIYIHAPRMASVVAIVVTDHVATLCFRWAYRGDVSYTRSDWFRIWWAAITLALLAGREYRQRRRFLIRQSFLLQLHRTTNTKNSVEKLLQNIVPPTVLDRMVKGERVVDVGPASVLFSDVCAFTAWSATRSAREVVHMLNVMYCRMDADVVPYGVNKIATIGDAYWAVCGLPRVVELVAGEEAFKHAQRLCAFALRMQHHTKWMRQRLPELRDIHIRVGVNSGDVCGGVVGVRQFSYQVFGEASRKAEELEKAAPADAVLISHETHRQLLREEEGHGERVAKNHTDEEAAVHNMTRSTSADVRGGGRSVRVQPGGTDSHVLLNVDWHPPHCQKKSGRRGSEADDRGWKADTSSAGSTYSASVTTTTAEPPVLSARALSFHRGLFAEARSASSTSLVTSTPAAAGPPVSNATALEGGTMRSHEGDNIRARRRSREEWVDQAQGTAADAALVVVDDPTASARQVDIDAMRTAIAARRYSSMVPIFTFEREDIETAFTEFSKGEFHDASKLVALVMASWYVVAFVIVVSEGPWPGEWYVWLLCLALASSAVSSAMLGQHAHVYVLFARFVIETVVFLFAVMLSLRFRVSSITIYPFIFFAIVGFVYTCLAAPGCNWLASTLLGMIFLFLPWVVEMIVQVDGHADQIDWSKVTSLMFGCPSLWVIGFIRAEIGARNQFLDQHVALIADGEFRAQRDAMKRILARSLPEFVLDEVADYLGTAELARGGGTDRLGSIVCHSYGNAVIMFLGVPVAGTSTDIARGGGKPLVEEASGRERGGPDRCSNSQGPQCRDAAQSLVSRNDALRELLEAAVQIVELCEEVISGDPIYRSCVKIKTVGDVMLVVAGLEASPSHGLPSSLVVDAPLHEPSAKKQAEPRRGSHIQLETLTASRGGDGCQTVDVEDSAIEAPLPTEHGRSPNDHRERGDNDSLSCSIATALHLAWRLNRLATERYRQPVSAGVHCGPITAGVLGTVRLIYDVFGDAVNTASRLQTTAKNGVGIWLTDHTFRAAATGRFETALAKSSDGAANCRDAHLATSRQEADGEATLPPPNRQPPPLALPLAVLEVHDNSRRWGHCDLPSSTSVGAPASPVEDCVPLRWPSSSSPPPGTMPPVTFTFSAVQLRDIKGKGAVAVRELLGVTTGAPANVPP